MGNVMLWISLRDNKIRRLTSKIRSGRAWLAWVSTSRRASRPVLEHYRDENHPNGSHVRSLPMLPVSILVPGVSAEPSIPTPRFVPTRSGCNPPEHGHEAVWTPDTPR